VFVLPTTISPEGQHEGELDLVINLLVEGGTIERIKQGTLDRITPVEVTAIFRIQPWYASNAAGQDISLLPVLIELESYSIFFI
jgi:hypothetical protein